MINLLHQTRSITCCTLRRLGQLTSHSSQRISSGMDVTEESGRVGGNLTNVEAVAGIHAGRSVDNACLEWPSETAVRNALVVVAHRVGKRQAWGTGSAAGGFVYVCCGQSGGLVGACYAEEGDILPSCHVSIEFYFFVVWS